MSRGGIFGAAFLSLLSSAVFADPPPIEAYATIQMGGLRLSPDGNSVGMFAGVEDRQALVLKDLSSGSTTVLNTEKTFFDWFEWKTSKRLVASLRFTSDRGRLNAVGKTRLVFFDGDGANLVELKFDRVTGNTGVATRPPQVQDRLVSLLPNDPEHVLVEATTGIRDVLHPDLLQVEIGSGRPFMTHRSSNDIVGYMADGNGQARAAVKIDRAEMGATMSRRTILVRETEESPWITINESDINHQDPSNRMVPLGFSRTVQNLFYVLTEEAGNHLAARAYDIGTQTLYPPMAANPNCDVIGLIQDHQVAGFRVPCEDNKVQYINGEWQRDWDILTKALKTRLVTILDRSEDGTRTLAMAQERPTAPPAYWLLDRRGGKIDVHWIGEAYAKVPRDQIAETKWFSYQARDGLTIPALVTLPAKAAPGPLPFVVLPHGGPTARDEIGFNWMVQFLASRGYGVLQPQFRGSTGYGEAFQEAGYGQWGLAMQDDITDGTRWLVAQGLADASRICIVGENYGGYAALMGVAKEPGLYACAGAFAPVTDVEWFAERLNNFAFQDINLPRLKGDKNKGNTVSPVENADKIRVPVLLMHGLRDFNVPADQSEEMERVLKSAGKKVEAVYLEKADHYFSQGSDRAAWLAALEKLLASTIGGKQSASAGAGQ